MKKILFVINNMDIGGIQKSLTELLACIHEKYDISLYCINSDGVMLKDVPESINILPVKKFTKVSDFSLDECKKLGKHYYFARQAFSLCTRVFSKRLAAGIFCMLNGKIPGKYDVAISFTQPVGDKVFYNLSNELVLKSVDAERKITFVHCDFVSYGGNTKYNRSLYKKFDAVAAVSDSVGKQFVSVNPTLDKKTFTVLNCCSFEQIRQKADFESVIYNTKSFVSVSRLGKEKGLLRCLDVFKKLKDEGYNFEWHIVGGGALAKELKNKITQYDMNDCVYLEGEQINPYRFIKNADWFLLPSYHEAAPMVYNEAASLGVPILTTNTLSAKELVEDRKLGIVCENTEEGLYAMLKKAAEPEYKFESSNTAVDNTKAIEQFEYICKK